MHTMRTNQRVKTFKKDLAAYSPQLIIAVPRLYENVYQGSMQKFAAGRSNASPCTLSLCDICLVLYCLV